MGNSSGEGIRKMPAAARMVDTIVTWESQLQISIASTKSSNDGKFTCLFVFGNETCLMFMGPLLCEI
jgi:hypothetical protein